MRAPTQTTLRETWELWEAGAKDGTVRTRSGDEYKPSALRGYEQAMRLRILPDVGALKLSEVTRVALQDLADKMLADGKDASTIPNTFLPLRALYRRACARGEVAVNPTSGLTLPAVRGKRDRIAAPVEAAALIAALPEADRPMWACASPHRGDRSGVIDSDRCARPAWQPIEVNRRPADYKQGSMLSCIAR